MNRSGGKKSFEPSCSECSVRNCYRRDRKFPGFCPSTSHEATAAETRDLYTGDSLDGRIARVAAEVESEYYCRATRLEEIVIFARKLGVSKLGIASCVGLLDEATLFAGVVRTAGIESRTVTCKVGAIDKTEIGLDETCKVCPGGHESCCNPVMQARVLNEWGSGLNVMVGLCVGHDALFSRHSDAPVVTFIVKDRVLAHNPIAAIAMAKSYYGRVRDFATFVEPRATGGQRTRRTTKPGKQSGRDGKTSSRR